MGNFYNNNKKELIIPMKHEMSKIVQNTWKYKKCKKCSIKRDSLCKFCHKCFKCIIYKKCVKIHLIIDNHDCASHKCLYCQHNFQKLCNKCFSCVRCIYKNKKKFCHPYSDYNNVTN
jgi:hypothetical protein